MREGGVGQSPAPHSQLTQATAHSFAEQSSQVLPGYLAGSQVPASSNPGSSKGKKLQYAMTADPAGQGIQMSVQGQSQLKVQTQSMGGGLIQGGHAASKPPAQGPKSATLSAKQPLYYAGQRTDSSHMAAA